MNRITLKAATRKARDTNILILLSLALYVIYVLVYGNFYHDDAYISLRYVLNLKRGHGLVWNPAEYVEGYTNFLWIILSALVSSVGLSFVLATKVLGFISCFGTLFFMGRYKNSKYLYASLLLAANGCYALWSMGGLETSAFASLAGICTILAVECSGNKKELFCLGLLLAALSMLRPDGLLFFFLILFYFKFRLKYPSSALIKGFLILYSPYYLWRFFYYGYQIFPNTYYAKSGFNIINLKSGVRYIQSFLENFGFPLGIFLFIKDFRGFIKRNFLPVAILAIYLIYIVKVGGDHMQGYRFIVHILPVFYILIGSAIKNLEVTPTFKTFLIFLNILATFGLTTSSLHIRGNFISHKPLLALEDKGTSRTRILYDELTTFEDPACFYGTVYGRYIKKNWPENSLVALNTAGSTPFYSGVPAIDMLGLNDKVIARQPIPKRRLKWQYIPGHVRGDGSYILSRKPEYIIIGSALGSSKAWFLSDLEVLEQKKFYDEYSYNIVSIRNKLRSEIEPYVRLGLPGNIFFKAVKDTYEYVKNIEDIPTPYTTEIPNHIIFRYFSRRQGVKNKD